MNIGFRVCHNNIEHRVSQSTIGWSINNWKDRTIDNIASSTTGRYGSNTDIVTTRTSRTSLGTSDWCYKKCATIGAITPSIWCHGSYHALTQANKYWRDFDSWWMLMQRPTALLSAGWANAIKFGTSTLCPTDRWFVIVRWSLESSGFAWHDITATVSDQWQMSRLDFYSHDRDFLLAVTTDMIVLNHQRLTYQRQMQERTALQRNNLEAAEKQYRRHWNSSKNNNNVHRQIPINNDRPNDHVEESWRYRDVSRRWQMIS